MAKEPGKLSKIPTKHEDGVQPIITQTDVLKYPIFLVTEAPEEFDGSFPILGKTKVKLTSPKLGANEADVFHALIHLGKQQNFREKEIEFINSFISLMKLRHSDEVEVTVVIPEQVPDTKIPPMLFISLLENAFKHGVNYPMKSYICFELQIIGNSLNCVIKNSKHKAAGNAQGEYSGIGLDNIKESLKLLYGDDFQLNILDKENEFEVDLKIPI